MECISCKTHTNNPRFCGRSCAASYNNKVAIKRRRTNKCRKCGDAIIAKQTYCGKCWKDVSQAVDMPLSQAKYCKYGTNNVNTLVRSRARSKVLQLRRPLRCCVCGYSKHVEVCHIKAVSAFSDDTMLSVINALENLTLLCPNCHWEFDHGEFTEPLPSVADTVMSAA